MASQRPTHRDGGHDDEPDLHAEVLELLLDKVRGDPYPSPTHLDMLEGMLRDDEVGQYVDVLREKVRHDAFPSLDHLRRLLELV